MTGRLTTQIRMPLKFVPHRFFLMCTVCMLVTATSVVQASHSATEPSDGTVRSFIYVKPSGEIAPFHFHVGQGRKSTLADFRSRIVLFNLWATWCPPCVREIPALDRLQAKFSKTDFIVLPLSQDHGGIAQVRTFYRRLGLRHLDVFSDPASRAGAGLPVDVLPASFLIGRDGRLTAFLRSYVDWDDPRAETMVRRLIAARQSQPPNLAE